MKEPYWLTREECLALHDMMVSLHGGLAGLRDGNKRTGFMMGAGFLERNGFDFAATEDDATSRTLALAAGEMTEAAYAAWLEENSKPAN